MKTIVKKSAMPIYIAAACWLIYAFIFPLYRLWHFLPPIAISVAAGLVSARFFKPKTVTVEEKLPKTGDALVDELVEQRRKYLAELRRLDAAIEDAELSGQIVRMENAFGKIIDHIIENPNKAPQIRRFMDYYLPTAVKLLQSYEKAGTQGVSGENIENTMRSVRGIMATIAQAFEKQLDSLFKDVALDISTDITVMENLLEAEGLKKDGGKK